MAAPLSKRRGAVGISVYFMRRGILLYKKG